MEKFDKAMERLRDELAKGNHGGVDYIGEYLTQRLTNDPSIADKLLKEQKTLQGTFKAIEDYARKHRTGNFACVDPAKAFELVNSYYGISPSENQEETLQAPKLTLLRGGQSLTDELDLDKLLGE